jgi:mitochondrial fission protein ELM1
VLIGAPQVILTGSQEAFGFQDADARLAFERLQKSLSQEGGSLHEVAFASSVSAVRTHLGTGAQNSRGVLRPGASARGDHAAVSGAAFHGRRGFAVDVVAVKE